MSNQSANQHRVDKTSLHEQFYSNPLAAPSVQSGGQGAENNLTNLDEGDEEDLEAQLFLMGNQNQRMSTQKAQSGLLPKRVDELERRMKIFEDEIIKRIQENQKYAKQMHAQVKKQAQTLSAQQTALDKLETQHVSLKNEVGQVVTQDFQVQIDELRDTVIPHNVIKSQNNLSDLISQIKFDTQQKVNDLRTQIERASKNTQQID